MRHEDTYDGARNSFDFCMIMVSNLSNKAHILRSIMGHITTNIQSYVMYEVLETAYVKLEAGLKRARDMDEVLREHSEYLLRLQEAAFLVAKAEPILMLP